VAGGEDGGQGPCWERRRTMTWAPAWNQGGLKLVTCVTLRVDPTKCEPTPHLPETSRCYTIKVARCVYSVQHQQMLQEISSLYRSTWLDLYALNPSIKTPDRVMPQGQLINVGHLYSVVPGDTLHKIAQRFGTSIDDILAMNADLHREQLDVIHTHQELCVLPASCLADVKMG